MVKSAKTLPVLVIASACSLLLCACGGGNNDSNNPKPPVISAQASFPATATASSTFAVTVSVTSSDNSGGTASVQIVDVGSVTPTISCGSSQTVTIDGASANFTCQAPQANLGSSNTHSMQVKVDGTAKVSASVDVVNGGQVNAQLTNQSGTAITQAAPGQQINVAFSTTSTPTGIGSYTVTAPSGWTVGNSGVCDINAQATSCNVSVTVASSAASGSYAITIDAAQGSSALSASSLSLTVKPVVIAAHISIPTSVPAGGTFTASAWLTSSGGTGASGGTASVQIVDVGTVTPQIDCGQPQTLTIDGAHGSFSCQAPQVTLGQNNTHQLQVNVDGKPALTSSTPVAVANDGRVDVQLASASGTVITAAKPGQSIDVAFSSTTTPVGLGKYTVTAPSGWTVGNGGVCEFTGQASCKVPVMVSASATNGAYTIKVAADEGSSKLSTGSLSLSVQSPPPTSVDDLAFFVAQNVSNTLYANLPSQTTTFTYQPVFLFKNISGGNLTIDSVQVNGLTNLKYGCNVQAKPLADYSLSATSACTLTATGLYAVSGDLANAFPTPATPTAPAGTASISISVGSGSQAFVQYDQNVVFVKYVPGTVAMRVVNQTGNHSVYIAATHQPQGAPAGSMVKFDSSTHVGTTTTEPSSGKFKANQLKLSQSGGLIYLPYENAGTVSLTRAVGGFNTTSPPNPTGSPTPPSFLFIELTYDQTVPGGSCTTSTCESLYLDQSYVNGISTLGSFNAMGKSDLVNSQGQALLTASAIFGTITDLTESELYGKIEQFFGQYGSPWAYDPARGKQNYIQKASATAPISEILAPVQVYQVAAFDPMPSDYYDAYVDALWTYLQTNPIYVNADAAHAAPGSSNPNQCVLKGQVVPASSTSPNAGKLVFAHDSGTCPAQAESTQGPWVGSTCGPNMDQLCADEPDDLVFEKFNKCDFLSAAGANNCHKIGGSTNPEHVTQKTFFENEGLWGPTGTYRAAVGTAIASYQAIGLLPPCSSTVMSQKNSAAYVNGLVENKQTFSNPSCLTGLTKPTWNVYVGALLPYVNVYTYTFSDFLGQSNTINFNANSLSQTLYDNLHVAQPITVILH